MTQGHRGDSFAAQHQFSVPFTGPMHAVHFGGSPPAHTANAHSSDAFGSAMRIDGGSDFLASGAGAGAAAGDFAAATGEQLLLGQAGTANSIDDPLMTHVAGATDDGAAFACGASAPFTGAASPCLNAHPAGANAMQRDVIGSAPRGPVASPNVRSQPFDIGRHKMYAGPGEGEFAGSAFHPSTLRSPSSFGGLGADAAAAHHGVHGALLSLAAAL